LNWFQGRLSRYSPVWFSLFTYLFGWVRKDTYPTSRHGPARQATYYTTTLLAQHNNTTSHHNTEKRKKSRDLRNDTTKLPAPLARGAALAIPRPAPHGTAHARRGARPRARRQALRRDAARVQGAERRVPRARQEPQDARGGADAGWGQGRWSAGGFHRVDARRGRGARGVAGGMSGEREGGEREFAPVVFLGCS
jgi:hypothetical protein